MHACNTTKLKNKEINKQKTIDTPNNIVGSQMHYAK